MIEFYFTATSNWSGVRQSYTIKAVSREAAFENLKVIAHNIS